MTKEKRMQIEIPKSWIKPENDDIEYGTPTAWCDVCHREVPFYVRRVRYTGVAKGVKYRFRGKKANCGICGNNVSMPELITYNMKKALLESLKEKDAENKDGK